MSASGGAASAARPEGASKSDLVSWLRSALADAEEIAREAKIGWDRSSVERGYSTYGPHAMAMSEHVDANDPAHVLRTVAAHRAILDRHGPGVSHPEECGRCNDPWPCGDVLSLLSIYAEDRPGFDPSWRAE